MPVKTKPVSGQSSWGNVLNTHLEQLIPNSGGGINTFDIFTDRPIYKAGTSTLLNEDDVGLTYLFTQTGNLHRFTWNTTLNSGSGGGEWKVLNESVINVKDYGAVGDGVADDTVALQRTVNYARNNNCKIIYMPGGRYFLENTVELDSNLTILGDGKNSLLIGNNNISIFLARGTKITTGDVVQRTSQYLENIILDGLAFVSIHIWNDTVTLVNFVYCKNCEVKNCYFDGYTYNSNNQTASVLHGIHYGGCFNCKFINNAFYAPGNTGKSTSCYGFNGLKDGSVSSGGYSQNNICIGVGDTGLGMWTGTENVYSDNDTFYVSSPGYTTVGIDCAGVNVAKINNARIIGGNVAIRVGYNLGYVDKNIEINNPHCQNQTEQAIKVFHEDFSVVLNGGLIQSNVDNATGLYVGMRPNWIGQIQIKNTIIDCIGNNSTAINFNLDPDHSLTLYNSNPIIKSGKLIGFLDEFRNIGELLGDLVFYQAKKIDITTTGNAYTTIAGVKLEKGYYKIHGDYVYTGAILNLQLILDNGVYNSQLFNSTNFKKPFIVNESGLVEFKSSATSGNSGSIENFSVYRIM